jgi:hypothetical protein
VQMTVTIVPLQLERPLLSFGVAAKAQQGERAGETDGRLVSIVDEVQTVRADLETKRPSHQCRRRLTISSLCIGENRGNCGRWICCWQSDNVVCHGRGSCDLLACRSACAAMAALM